MTSGELFDVLKGLVNNLSDDAFTAYTAALNEIERKVSDSAFVEIIEVLDGMEARAAKEA